MRRRIRRDRMEPRIPAALLSYGFRPFFLAAAIWAAIALAIWIAMLTTGLVLPTRFDPLDWHIHEMLFGFVPAAVAGFLLTAISQWTGRRPVSGGLLGLLIGLWLLGRIDVLTCDVLPVWLAIAADIAFPFALAAIVAREIIGARNRRNYPMIAPVVVLGLAQLMMDLGAIGGIGWHTGYGWRLGLVLTLVLISVVGGRIIPAFTRTWQRLGAPLIPSCRLTLARSRSPSDRSERVPQWPAWRCRRYAGEAGAARNVSRTVQMQPPTESPPEPAGLSPRRPAPPQSVRRRPG